MPRRTVVAVFPNTGTANSQQQPAGVARIYQNGVDAGPVRAAAEPFGAVRVIPKAFDELPQSAVIWRVKQAAGQGLHDEDFRIRFHGIRLRAPIPIGGAVQENDDMLTHDILIIPCNLNSEKPFHTSGISTSLARNSVCSDSRLLPRSSFTSEYIV